MAVKLTKKDLIKEIIRCGKDPLYFINQYARIQHPVRGLIPFNTYHYQGDVIRGFINHRMNVVLKARQLGLSTITAAYIAWFILLHRDKNVLVVATKLDTAKNIIRTIRNIFKYLPKWLVDVGRITIDNRHSIELANGSRVKAVTTSSDVGRSEAVSLLVVDEVAHIKGFEEIWTGLWPTISTGGHALLFSTPNGTGNFFHQQFVQAQNGENSFNCRFGTYVNPNNPKEVYDDRLMWWVHPDHDETWFATETAGKSPREIAQEYLCNFNASGDTFIWHEDIAKIEEHATEAQRRFPLDRNIWIWEEPDINGTYLISCDVARGDAQDCSAFHVLRLDTSPIVQVAEYKGKVKPDLLGTYLVSMAQYYNNATIAPENNSGYSGQTILKIKEANYPYLHYSRQRKPKVKTDRQVDPYYAERRNDYLPGYAVTSANRLEMLAKMEQFVRLGELWINSPRLVAEFKTFIVNEHNKPEAQRGYNDDLVMALAGGLWVRDQAFIHSYRDNEMTHAMMDSIRKSDTQVNAFRDFNLYKRSMIKEMQPDYKAKMADGNEIDFSWLIRSG